MKKLLTILLLYRQAKSVIKSYNACDEAINWSNGYSSKKAWQICERGDWMLWICSKLPNITRQQLVFAACQCARLSLKYTTDTRVLKCIETTESWCKGIATIEQVRAAADAATDAAYAAVHAIADAADTAAAAAATAAYAAVHAVANAADTAAAYAAVHAANAADAATDAAYAAVHAKKHVLKECADICRLHLFPFKY